MECRSDFAGSAVVFCECTIAQRVAYHGAGSFAGITLGFFKAHSVSLLTSPAGGFFVLAIVMAVVSAVSKKDSAALGGTADAIISACAEKKEA